MEAEITGKILRSGVRPYEVPISYKARSREAGKKLTWRDGVQALAILVRERVRHPSRLLRTASVATHRGWLRCVPTGQS